MRQDPITLSRAAVVTAVLIVVALVVFGISATALTLGSAGHLLSGIATTQRPGAAVPPPRTIEGLYQTLIDQDDRTAVQRRDDERRLASYGWVDPSRGVIRIPITRAMELVAEEQR